MSANTFLQGEKVNIVEILDARSIRSSFQKQLLSMKGAESLISFTMNMAGEVKSFPALNYAFEEGISLIKHMIPKHHILFDEVKLLKTGPEGYFVLDLPAPEVKRRMAEIEENHPLGRIFDMDVLGKDGISLSRTSLGLPKRRCIICGDDAKVCGRSRKHPIELVIWKSVELMTDYYISQKAEKAAEAAGKALLYEVSATPKPGLVDRNNSGSHKDMDFFTFVNSNAALIPWFKEFFIAGANCDMNDVDTGDDNRKLFGILRFKGVQAEKAMFAATGGVNTHKGLVFACAVLLGAAGKLCREEMEKGNFDFHFSDGLTGLQDKCRHIARYALEDFQLAERVLSGELAESTCAQKMAGTHGMSLNRTYGITGARGEAASGFPTVFRVGYPTLSYAIEKGFSLNDAACYTLLALIAETVDTNMIKRGGREEAKRRRTEARELLPALNSHNLIKTMENLDQEYIRYNLSPGGSADMLALSLLVYFLHN